MAAETFKAKVNDPDRQASTLITRFASDTEQGRGVMPNSAAVVLKEVQAEAYCRRVEVA
jgi:hypothetical protein